MARGIPKASAQSTVLWSIGDLTCQKLEKRTSIDTRRLASNAAYGAVVLGPVGHLWYEGALVVFCERFIPNGGAAMVAAKLAFDLCVFGPAHLACFLGWSGFWSFPPSASPDDAAARGGGGGNPRRRKGEPRKGARRRAGKRRRVLLRRGDAKGPAGPLRAALSRARASVARVGFPLRARRRHRVLGPRADGELRVCPRVKAGEFILIFSYLCMVN